LDFGLAKVVGGKVTDQQTTITEPGRIIGTPAYMSPEQARGKSTDHRTDIWSFGCIMYQMLTGQFPFEGQTATDTLVRIIEHQPDWEALPQETPENVRVLLRRCLEKDPDKRLGDFADAAREISETLSKSAIAQAVAKSAKTRKVGMIIGVVAVSIVLFIISLKFIPRKEIQPSLKEIRLVVLPFENLGPADDEWFADGMTDEITSRLAGIHGLGVISRQSAIQYKNKEKSAPQIAKELGIDYILEGTIQREQPSDPNSQVRIRSQLIKATDDIHVWVQNYDNDMSKVFQLQSEVAEQVAQGLDITLLEPQRQALRYEPTENMEAYAYYLRGNEYSSRPYQNKDNVMLASEMYEKAIDLDDKFALAHAKLSQVYSGMYWFNTDHSEKRITLAWKESRIALELDPELPEAHWARGVYYYWCQLDYVCALKELEIARKGQPNNSRILATIGHIQRRQRKYEEALANYMRACELNPQFGTLAGDLASTFRELRRYQEAEYYYERAISLTPNEDYPHFLKATLYLVWKGSTEEARKVLERASKYINLADVPRMVNLLITLDLYDKNYQGALDRLSLKSQTDKPLSYSDALRYAQIYDCKNENKSAKEYYKQAVENLQLEIPKDPNKAWLRSAVGIAYAGLGRKDDAIREGKRAVDLLPYDKDAQRGFRHLKDLAKIYVMVDEYDKAIDQLKFLLSVPGELSIPLLQLEQTWDPLCDHPRYNEILEIGK